jgi:site-specific recombinase XerD
MWHLNEFREYLRSRQLSDRTIGCYRLHVDRFIRYCDDIDDCKAVSDADVLKYIHDVVDRLSHTPGWKYVGLLCLKKYFAFLVERSLLFAPPLVPVKKPRYCSGSYRAIDKQKIRMLLDTFPVTKASDIMAKAILELGYSAALRPGEIRALKIEDIDFSAGLLFIEQGKGKKDRTVPVGTLALMWIRRYVQEVRPKHLADNAERCVFIGMRTGVPLTHRGITEFLSYRLKRLGLANVSPHQLRASAATHMVSEGMSIGYLQRMLGHKRLNTTKIYVQIHADELKKVMQASHPRVHLQKTIDSRRSTP